MQQNFSDHLKKLPIFSVVCSAGEKLGVDTYVVGGYVRDLILKRPSKDIDFVCVGSGVELASEVCKELGKKAHHYHN